MEWCEKHSPFRFDLSCLQHANFKPGLRSIKEKAFFLHQGRKAQ